MHLDRFHLALLAAMLGLVLAGCADDHDDDVADDDVADDDMADDDSATDDDDDTLQETNHPPTAPEVSIDPESPRPGDTLTCVIDVASTDANNDPIAYDFRWLRDGADTGLTGETVPPQETLDMGEWTAVARGFDGELFSDEATASAFVGPDGFRFTTTAQVTGGLGPGTANVTYEWIMVDDTQAEEPDELCSYTYDLSGTLREVHTEQGDDFYVSIDTIIEFDTVQATVSTCPVSLDDEFAPVSDPLGYMEWWLSPLAVISCDQIWADPALAATQFLNDAWSLGLTDGTMLSWCDDYGPLMQSYGYYGALEGLWVRPSDSATGDYGLGLNYLPAPNGDIGGLGTFDSWSVMGFFHAALNNAEEPTDGLEGPYEPFMMWIWSY